MSFYLPFTKIENSQEMAVASGFTFSAEGQAVVRQSGATANGVLPSTGQASDIFCGFAFAGTSAAPFAETFFNKVEVFTVPTGGAVQLSLLPVSGQVFVFDNTTNSAVGSPTVTGQTVSGLTAGDQVTITYKYVMNQVQARTQYGDIQPGGYVGAYVQQIGVITRGTVFTTEYDASKNWAAATAIKLAANGQVTDQSGSGNAISFAYVSGLPGTDEPFLGITFSAP